MTANTVKVVRLATITVASLFLSSCVMLTRSQTDHIHRTLDHNLVEVQRGERILELVNEGAIKADGVVIKLIEQRNKIIRNNTDSIRKHIGHPPEE